MFAYNDKRFSAGNFVLNLFCSIFFFFFLRFRRKAFYFSLEMLSNAHLYESLFFSSESQLV